MITGLSDRFEEDYKNFSSRIEKISDSTKQKEALALLNELVANVSRIEKTHSEFVLGNKNALSSVSDDRKNIIKIRKNLEEKLKFLNV